MVIQVAKYAFRRNPMERGRGHGYSHTIPKPLTRSLKMNIAKNMEALFIAAIALVAATSFATAAVPGHQKISAAAAPFEGKMQVVTIVGKRLSAVEKAPIAQ
jgi:hypothetical protein